MATFVHNEPTSLSIIQENKLPEVFYNAVEAGLEPAIEVNHSFGRFVWRNNSFSLGYPSRC